MFGRVLAFSILLVMSMICASEAAAADLQGPFCHAVTAKGGVPPAADAYSCEGKPEDYSDRRLWLRAPIAGGEGGARLSLLVRTSRFQGLEARFLYPDGARAAGAAVAGDFSDRWRIGGQLVFPAPARDARPTYVEFGVDGLASFDLLQARVVPTVEASRTLAFVALLIGAATSLLGLSALYNMLLAVAVRDKAVAWHAAWVFCLLLYTLFWSQLALVIFPGFAGPLAGRLMTASAALAIGFASLSAFDTVEPRYTPSWLRRLLVAAASLTVAAGLCAAVAFPALLRAIATFLGPLVLFSLLTAWLFTIWGWRQGSKPARAFTLSWALPMIGLALTELGGLGQAFYGSGPYVTIIVASALQTVSLSLTTSMRFGFLRRERDAVAAEKRELEVLVERDQLTALLNRRGFMKRAERMFERADGMFQLILIDLDRFKAINDDFGHDVGDVVLRAVGACIDRELPVHSFVGRLGGEEFGICLSGSDSEAAELAGRVRAALEALDLDVLHADGGTRVVTASFGIGRSGTAEDFVDVYREADRALYVSKRAGRNRVTHARLLPDSADAEPAVAI